MDAKTLEALKASIAKWERNAVAEKPEDYLTGPDDCALCGLFFKNRACRGCPVRERTRLPACDGTPYLSTHIARCRWKDGLDTTAARAHSAARAEVEFLKSLLPAEEA